MRKAEVYRNGILAGYLTEYQSGNFTFSYAEPYFTDHNQPAISLTLPKSQKEYHSNILFPFFSNMLSEGVNRHLQNVQWKIDENDDFGLLLKTARYDTIGAISIKPIENE
ncbi:MAG: HipA N-terminal domain-containing protein [Bacteroidales bacterium]|jgi:serine/threonine-protein kinase HipA|nr:HipA N-terminal domain-containing protein [Bacteroidales bacterium]